MHSPSSVRTEALLFSRDGNLLLEERPDGVLGAPGCDVSVEANTDQRILALRELTRDKFGIDPMLFDLIHRYNSAPDGKSGAPVDMFSQYWPTQKHLQVEPLLRAYSMADLDELDRDAKLAPQVSQLLEHMAGNYQCFIAQNMGSSADWLTPMELVENYRSLRDQADREWERTKHKRHAGFGRHIPAFLMANETPQSASRTFRLAKGLEKNNRG